TETNQVKIFAFLPTAAFLPTLYGKIRNFSAFQLEKSGKDDILSNIVIKITKSNGGIQCSKTISTSPKSPNSG
ncbi:MAG: hypothetical protein J6R86_08340, partial [Lentisphaeria bacterium]|nr:hypothetical protein [Lentisphaeria bacterium]